MSGILQDKVCITCMTDLDDLKYRTKTEWAKLDHAVIAAVQLMCISGAVVSRGASRPEAVI